ncbi:MAG TPA: Gfo/Idh/MocA family oxidoreductase [Fimbriimonadaceae bacterium]|nr:Gfo/Idh/MocA family oxidoreductase [Fimbriimonadaceae bacterium]HRJ95816.1 Gfo/Idh/MocA family oxidoreductase [Fimbriimonadaceae bacterium]
MKLRLGFFGIAHMHAYGYAHAASRRSDVDVVGVWDPEPERGIAFADKTGMPWIESADALLEASQAVVVCCENTLHAEFGERVARAGRHLMVEKPLVTNEADGERFLSAVSQAGVKLMTAFPCRYAPAFDRLRTAVKEGSFGRLVAVCSTNRGSCPFGWFTEPGKSGGGAMIDHVVHVADLLRAALGRDPSRVYARTGNGMYARAWEDVAMLTLEYDDGFFATLDSSWSRPKSYKTWGDVTMNAVFENAVIELDLFNPHIDVFRDETMRHTLAGYGSDLDRLLVADFVRCVVEDLPPPVTGEDGLAAARVAFAGYRSAERGEPVSLKA